MESGLESGRARNVQTQFDGTHNICPDVTFELRSAADDCRGNVVENPQNNFDKITYFV